MLIHLISCDLKTIKATKLGLSMQILDISCEQFCFNAHKPSEIVAPTVLMLEYTF